MFLRRGFCPDYGLAASGAVFDPATMIAGASMAATGIGTIAGASGAEAAGQAKLNDAQFQAAQLRSNEGGEIGSSQQQMLDTQQKTRLAMSAARARAAAGGANAGVGSPATTAGEIASRGSYLAGMDLFRGQNEATGTENRASGAIYSGEAAKEGADITAFGTIAGGIGSMAQQFGRFQYNGGGGRFG